MIKAIIVDDEEHCVNRLADLLERHCKHSIELVGSFFTVDEAKQGIQAVKPDLVFLDIQLQEQTGFDLLTQLPKIDFEVIFTTAYDNYAIKAFKFSAIDYLLKPIDPDDLILAINKLQKTVHVQQAAERFDNLAHNLKAVNGTLKKITVATSKGLEFLAVNDIIRCEADINYTTIFLKDRQQLMVAKTLKDFEDMLAEHGFFRIHNSHLINLDFIKSYHKGKGGYVTLNDNSSFEVSTRRKDEFLRKMQEI